jgi:hypothetical protein
LFFGPKAMIPMVLLGNHPNANRSASFSGKSLLRFYCKKPDSMHHLGLPICSNKYQKWHLPRQGLPILKCSIPPYWLKNFKSDFPNTAGDNARFNQL